MSESVNNTRRLAQDIKLNKKSGRLNIGRIASNVATVSFLEQSYSKRDKAASEYAGKLLDRTIDEGYNGGGIFDGAAVRNWFDRGGGPGEVEYNKLLQHAANKFGIPKSRIEAIRKAETDWILDGVNKDDVSTYIFGRRMQKK